MAKKKYNKSDGHMSIDKKGGYTTHASLNIYNKYRILRLFAYNIKHNRPMNHDFKIRAKGKIDYIKLPVK